MTAKMEAVDVDEGRKIFDAAAWRLLHISGDEFLACWDKGGYEDDDRLEVMRVAMLLPFAR